MKKIFAIALALVMVLSMASAFASACVTGPFEWTCPADVKNCGKATVEVVPYVKVNAACNLDGFEYQVSECASAVTSEKVYWGVKLTLDANPDPEWFTAAGDVVTMTYKGLVAADGSMPETLALEFAEDEDLTVKNVFMYDFEEEAWLNVADDEYEFTADQVDEAKVDDATKAKVCATIHSEVENFVAGLVGDFGVVFTEGESFVVVDPDNQANSVTYELDEDEKVTAIVKTNDACSTAFYNAVVAFFGIDMFTCLNQDTVNDNLAWDDKVEDCFVWGTKAASIVDADCVVAIPKTGDASVLAWLF